MNNLELKEKFLYTVYSFDGSKMFDGNKMDWVNNPLKVSADIFIDNNFYNMKYIIVKGIKFYPIEIKGCLNDEFFSDWFDINKESTNIFVIKAFIDNNKIIWRPSGQIKYIGKKVNFLYKNASIKKTEFYTYLIPIKTKIKNETINFLKGGPK